MAALLVSDSANVENAAWFTEATIACLVAQPDKVRRDRSGGFGTQQHTEQIARIIGISE